MLSIEQYCRCLEIWAHSCYLNYLKNL